MALNLMCASGADVSDATATASNVLTGKTFYAGADEGIKTGTMVDNGAKTATLSPGGSYIIPAGYHNGAGKVTASRWTGNYYLLIAIQFQIGYDDKCIPEHAAFALAYNGTTEPSIYNKTLMAGNIAGQSNICGVGMLLMGTDWGNYQYANCVALANIYDIVDNLKYPKGSIIHLKTGWHVFRTY